MLSRGLKMMSLRWAFRCSTWQPTEEEWNHGMACIQREERERIRQLAYQRDAKSTLAGRLLIRKAICDSLRISYADVQLGRTDKGKPYLQNALDRGSKVPGFDFNISHQGDYVLLAAESSYHVGVDLMNIDRPVGSKSVEQFFSTMERQFTKQEWNAIKSTSNECEQLTNFYRFWCLKESFVKLVGVGVGYSLRRLNFCTKSPLTVGRTVTDTKVQVDFRPQDDWKFEETLLDNTHVVAVALRRLPDVTVDASGDGSTCFVELKPEDIFQGTVPLDVLEQSDWRDFSGKPPSPAVQERKG